MPDGSMRYMAGGFAGVFMGEARRAVDRAKESAAAAKAPQAAGATATAILMSCAATEAALSEYATYLASPAMMKNPLSDTLVGEIRDGSEPLYTRYSRLLEQYDPSLDCQHDDAFKNFRCLVQLRNHIAHRKASFLGLGDWPNGLANCRKRIPYTKTGAHDWTSILLVPKVAQWAVDTGTTWLGWAEERLPDLDYPASQP